MIYGNKFYGYGVDSLSESVVLSEEFDNLNNIICSLNENTIILNEASFGDIIKNIFSSIGKIIVKLATFIKTKVLAFFGKIKGFFDKIVNGINKMKVKKSSDDNSSSNSSNEFVESSFDKELKNAQDGFEMLKAAMDDLSESQSEMKNITVKAAETLQKHKEEHDKYKEESDKEWDAIKKKMDGLSNKNKKYEESEPKINSTTIIIKKYSDEFDNVSNDYLMKSFAQLHDTSIFGIGHPELFDEDLKNRKGEPYYENHEDYLEQMKYYETERDNRIEHIEDSIRKYIDPFKPFKAEPSKCFIEDSKKFTYNSNVDGQKEKDEAAKLFKNASVFFVDEIKRINNVLSLLKWLKEKLDKMQPDGKHAEYYQKYPKMIEFEKPIITTETKFYKENLQTCTFLTKQCMSAIKTNVVSGMKFILLAREW